MVVVVVGVGKAGVVFFVLCVVQAVVYCRFIKCSSQSLHPQQELYGRLNVAS